MIKQFFFLVTFFLMGAVLVNSSLNCPSNSDALDEFKSISSAALLEFLGSPEDSKLSSNEVSDLSSFYDKYKNSWNNADCNEIGTNSGSTIKTIIEKYTGIVDAGLNCRVENPNWNIGQTFEGTEVTLTVDAPKCDDGAVVSFVVKERDFTKDDDSAIKNPDSAVVLNQKTTTTWDAEWQRDEEQTPSGPKNDEPPEYYFTASLGSSSVKSGLLIVTKCTDADRDGYSSVTCGGNDCRDNDANIHPNLNEICDNKDNNCNNEIDEKGICGHDLARRTNFLTGNIIAGEDRCVGDPDLDIFSAYLRSPALTNSSSGWSPNYGKYDFTGNGIIDLSDLFSFIDNLEGADLDKDNYDTTTCHNDCNDGNKNVNPGAVEVCDGNDNNCNLNIDELFDRDNDKYTTCGTKTDGTDTVVDTRIDCNDGNRNVNPGAAEVCDGNDNNCNRESDEGGVCGYDIARRNSFSTGTVVASKDSCIGDPDLDLMSSYLRSPALSTSSSGWSPNYGKYDFSGDGIIDLTDMFSLIDNLQGADSDRDNYDTTTCHNDCNDGNRNVNPGAAEVCDGNDNNCDTKVDYVSSVNDLDNSCGTDGLVSTENTRFVNVNYACQQKEEKEWNKIDYFCAEGTGCNNRVISTTWYGTGNVNNINQGAICRSNFCSGSSTLNYNFRCDNGQCTGTSSNCNTGDYCSESYRYFEGSCSKGACSFNREYCPLGCNNGRCNQDPCAGVSCNNVCTTGQLGNNGRCSGGKCYYTWDYCQYGCADNTQCNSPPVNKCAGVTCNPYCSGDYKFSTKCNSNTGRCVYQSYEICQYGCDSGTGQCKPQPRQSCSCTYGDQCLQNWQCTTIGGVTHLCYNGKLRTGFSRMCR